jgi:hypothetical protein
MENAKKHIFYPTTYPNINCTLCHIQPIDTWPHLLLACLDPNINRLKIKKHNNAVWAIHKLLLSYKTSRCLTLINAGKQNNKPQDRTIPAWLLSCICPTKPCHYNARLKPNILLVLNHPHDQPPPTHPRAEITI